MSIRAASVIALSLLAACGGDSRPTTDAPAGGDGATGDCVDGQTRCLGFSFEACTDGQWGQVEACTAVCDDTLGCIDCTPNTQYCVGEDVTQCTAEGTAGAVIETCTGNVHCNAGMCVDPCVEAASSRSYIGCEYWAVDLDNAHDVYTTPDQVPLGLGCGLLGVATLTGPICYDPDSTVPDPVTGGFKTTAGLCDPGPTPCPTNYTCSTTQYCGLNAQTSPFAIVVSNPQTYPVMVTLSDATGHTAMQTIAPGAVQPLFPQQLGFADKSLDHTVLAPRAYKLVADGPIVAYQFNPLDNVNVFSNDASLLVPRTVYDQRYIAMTRETIGARPDSSDYNAYVAIVAWQDDTMVQVTPTVATKPGYGSPMVPALAAGVPTTFTLDAFEVLQLAAAPNQDLTGTQIVTMDPTETVGVFGGVEAGYLPHAQAPPGGTNGPCCADHLEEMMFPTSTWGKDFAVARSQVRLPQVGEPDVVRVLAQQPGTTLTFQPNPISGSCGTLAVGQFCEVEIANDTLITASEPVLVGHFLKSVLWTDALGSMMFGTGDPSMAIVAPIEQYRTSYTVLVPQQYQQNYAAIVLANGESARIDGADVTSQLTSIVGGFRAGRVLVAPGRHLIECSGNGCGVEIMGWSRAVSYMFAGGLDLEVIVVE
jgi:hypothetical protein